MNAKELTLRKEKDGYRVRFENPDQFLDIDTPRWANKIAQAVSEGSEVKMGKAKGSRQWRIQSIKLKEELSEEEALSSAREIAERVST